MHPEFLYLPATVNLGGLKSEVHRKQYDPNPETNDDKDEPRQVYDTD